ncbi:MAG: LysR family transcriptional regulator [Limosilactobacillus sp.]
MNRLLESFITIANIGSIASAAANLHITSTALLK